MGHLGCCDSSAIIQNLFCRVLQGDFTTSSKDGTCAKKSQQAPAITTKLDLINNTKKVNVLLMFCLSWKLGVLIVHTSLQWWRQSEKICTCSVYRGQNGGMDKKLCSMWLKDQIEQHVPIFGEGSRKKPDYYGMAWKRMKICLTFWKGSNVQVNE